MYIIIRVSKYKLCTYIIHITSHIIFDLTNRPRYVYSFNTYMNKIDWYSSKKTFIFPLLYLITIPKSCGSKLNVFLNGQYPSLSNDVESVWELFAHLLQRTWWWRSRGSTPTAASPGWPCWRVARPYRWTPTHTLAGCETSLCHSPMSASCSRGKPRLPTSQWRSRAGISTISLTRITESSKNQNSLTM